MSEGPSEQPPASNIADLTRGRPFQKGNTAGRGRPAGSRNKATLLLDRLADADAVAIQKQVIEAAKNGDLKGAELILARIWPPRRGRPVRLNLPPVKTAAEVSDGLAAVVEAMAEGLVTPEEAATMSGVLEARRKALETEEIVERLEGLERRLQEVVRK